MRLKGRTAGFSTTLKTYVAQLAKDNCCKVDDVLTELYKLGYTVPIDKLVELKLAYIMGYIMGSTLLHARADPQKTIHHIHTGLCSAVEGFTARFLHGLSMTSFLPDSITIATTIAATQSTLVNIYQVVFEHSHFPLHASFFSKLKTLTTEYFGTSLDICVSSKDTGSSEAANSSPWLNPYAQFTISTISTFFKSLQMNIHGCKGLETMFYLRSLLKRSPSILNIYNVQIEQLIPEPFITTNATIKDLLSPSTWRDALAALKADYINIRDSPSAHEELEEYRAYLPADVTNLVILFPQDLLQSMRDAEIQPIVDLVNTGWAWSSLARVQGTDNLVLYNILTSRVPHQAIDYLLETLSVMLKEAGKALADSHSRYDKNTTFIIEAVLLCCYYTAGLSVFSDGDLTVLKQLLVISLKHDKYMFLPLFRFLILVSIYQPLSIEEQQMILKSITKAPSDSLTCNVFNAVRFNHSGTKWLIKFAIELFELDFLDLQSTHGPNAQADFSEQSSLKHTLLMRDAAYRLFADVFAYVISRHCVVPCPILSGKDVDSALLTQLFEHIIGYLISPSSECASTSQSFYCLLDAFAQHSKRFQDTMGSASDSFDLYGFLASQLLIRKDQSAASGKPSYSSVNMLDVLLGIQEKNGIQVKMLINTGLVDSLHTLLRQNFHLYAPNTLLFLRSCTGYNIDINILLQYAHTEFVHQLPDITDDVLFGFVPVQELEEYPRIYHMCCLCACITHAWVSSQSAVDASWSSVVGAASSPLNLLECVLLIYLFHYSTSPVLIEKLYLLMSTAFNLEDRWECTLASNLPLAVTFLATLENGQIPTAFGANDAKIRLTQPCRSTGTNLCYPNLAEFVATLSNRLKLYAQQDCTRYYALVMLACPYGHKMVIPDRAHYLDTVQSFLFYAGYLDTDDCAFSAETTRRYTELGERGLSADLARRHQWRLDTVVVGSTSLLANLFHAGSESGLIEKVLPALLLSPNAPTVSWLERVLLQTERSNSQHNLILSQLQSISNVFHNVQQKSAPILQNCLETHAFVVYKESSLGMYKEGQQSVYSTGDQCAMDTAAGKTLSSIHILLHSQHDYTRASSISINLFSIHDVEIVLTLLLEIGARKLTVASSDWTYCLDCAFPVDAVRTEELVVSLAVSGFGSTAATPHSSFLLGTSSTPTCGLTASINGYATSIRLLRLTKLPLPFKLEVNTAGPLVYDSLIVSPFIFTPFQIHTVLARRALPATMIEDDSLFGSIFGISRDFSVQGSQMSAMTEHVHTDSAHPLSIFNIIRQKPEKSQSITVEGRLDVFCDYLQRWHISLSKIASLYVGSFETASVAWQPAVYNDCRNLLESQPATRLRGFFCGNCSTVSSADYLLFDVICAILHAYNKTGIIMDAPPEGYMVCCPYCAMPSSPPSRKFVQKESLRVTSFLYDTQTHASQQQNIMTPEHVEPNELVFAALKTRPPEYLVIYERSQPSVNHLVSVIPLSSLFLYNEFIRAITAADGTVMLDDVLFKLGYLEPMTPVPFYSGFSLLVLILQLLESTPFVPAMKEAIFLASQLSTKTVPKLGDYDPKGISAFLDYYRRFFTKVFLQPKSALGKLADAKRTGVLGTVHHFLFPHEQVMLYNTSFIVHLTQSAALSGITRQTLLLLLGDLNAYVTAIERAAKGDINLLMRRYPTLASKLCGVSASRQFLERLLPTIPESIEVRNATYLYLRDGFLSFNCSSNILQHTLESSCFVHAQCDSNVKLFLSVSNGPSAASMLSGNITLDCLFAPLNKPQPQLHTLDYTLLLPACRHTILESSNVLSKEAADALQLLFSYAGRDGSLISAAIFVFELVQEASIRTIPSHLINFLVDELIRIDVIDSASMLWSVTTGLSVDSTPLMLYILRLLMLKLSASVRVFSRLLTVELWYGFLRQMLDAHLVQARSISGTTVEAIASFSTLLNSFTDVASEVFGTLYNLLAAENTARTPLGLAFIIVMSRNTVFIAASLHTHRATLTDVARGTDALSTGVQPLALLAEHAILNDMLSLTWLTINRLANICATGPTVIAAPNTKDNLTIIDNRILFNQLQIAHQSLQSALSLAMQMGLESCLAESRVAAGSSLQAQDLECFVLPSLKLIAQLFYAICFFLCYGDKTSAMPHLNTTCAFGKLTGELCFEIIKLSNELLGTADRFLTSIFALLASFMFYSARPDSTGIDPMICFKLSAGPTIEGAHIHNMEFIIPLVSILRVFYCLQSRSPQDFSQATHHLLLIVDAILQENTPEEVFKYYFSDVVMVLDMAQFFFTAPFVTGDIVGPEERRTLSGSRSLLEMINPNEYLVYQNVQKFDCTLQIRCRITAIQEIQKAFPMELDHIRRCATSEDPFESIYSCASHILLVLALVYGLICRIPPQDDTVIDDLNGSLCIDCPLSATPQNIRTGDGSLGNGKGCKDQIDRIMMTITSFLFKNVRSGSIDKAYVALASLLSLIFSEYVATLLARYTLNSEVEPILQCLHLLEFISATLAGVSYEHHTPLYLSPITQAVALSDNDPSPEMVVRLKLHRDLIESENVDLAKIGKFADTVCSAVLRLLSRYLDVAEMSLQIVSNALKSLQALYLVFIRILKSPAKTLTTMDLFIEYVVCVLDCYILVTDKRLTEELRDIMAIRAGYETLLVQILTVDVLAPAFQESIRSASAQTHPHSLETIVQTMQNDVVAKRLYDLYLSGAETGKIKVQFYKNYATMLSFITSKSVVDAEDNVPTNMAVDGSEKHGKAPVKFAELFQGFNYTEFKIAQGLINMVLAALSRTTNEDLAQALVAALQAMIPFSSMSLFYLLASLVKLGSSACVVAILQLIYKNDVGRAGSPGAILGIIRRYIDQGTGHSSTLQSGRFYNIVIAESYLFGRHSLRLASLGLSGSAHIIAKSSSSLANAPIRAIAQIVSKMPYVHLTPTYTGTVFYLLSAISAFSKHFHLGRALTSVAGYHRVSHEFTLRIKNTFAASCCFSSTHPASRVLEHLYTCMEREALKLLRTNACLNLGEVLPPTEVVLFCAYTNYESEVILANEGLLILTNVAVYFIPGWKLKSNDKVYGIREHAFKVMGQDGLANEASTNTLDDDEAQTEAAEPTLMAKIVSSMRGIMASLLVTARVPSEETDAAPAPRSSQTQKELLATVRQCLSLLGKGCGYPPRRPVTEYAIQPIIDLPESHTQQLSLEKRCLADINVLLTQTSNPGLKYVKFLPLVTHINLSDISTVLWKESAHRCTQVEIMLRSGESFLYEVLDSISSLRLRLEQYANDYAFVMRVQQECSRSLITKAPIINRLGNCQIMLQNNAVLSTTALALSLVEIALTGALYCTATLPSFEVILPHVASLTGYIEKWTTHLNNQHLPAQRTTEHSPEADLYDHPYELPFPHKLSCISIQYTEVLKETVKTLNGQIVDLFAYINDIVKGLKTYFKELLDSSLLHKALCTCYHINEHPNLNIYSVASRVSTSMPWAQLLNDLSIPVLLFTGQLNHLEAMLAMNLLAGRVSSDVAFYPVLPWLADDRSLTKTVMEQSASKRVKYLDRYNSLTSAPFLAGSHYSTSGFVAGMLLRAQPFTASAILLHDGKFDNPDRIFSSVSDLWESVRDTNLSECRELVPELFYAPSMFINESQHDFGIKSTGEVIHDLVCTTANEGHCPASRDVLDTYLHVITYTLINREKILREDILPDLYQWCRLLFGDKQNSLANFNVYYWLTYPNAVVLDCISNLSTRVSTYVQLKNFGIGCRNVLTRTAEELPILQHLYQSLLEQRGKNETKTRIYDYFLHIDDLLKTLHSSQVVLLRTAEGEHMAATNKADICCPKLELPWFYNLTLMEVPVSSRRVPRSPEHSATIFALAPGTALVLMSDRRTAAVLGSINGACCTLNVVSTIYGFDRVHVSIRQCFAQEGCIIVALTDMTVHLIMLDLELLNNGKVQVLGCRQIRLLPPLTAVTVSRPHGIVLVSTPAQNTICNLYTCVLIANLHAVEASSAARLVHNVTCSQICDVGGRIWLLNNGLISCWTTSLALLYVLAPAYEATAFLAVSDTLLITGDAEGVLRIYQLQPSVISSTMRVKIRTDVSTDSEPSILSLICMVPSLRPSHPLAVRHSRYFKERTVSVLVPALLAEISTISSAPILKISMDAAHTCLVANDQVVASITPLCMRLPRYVDGVPVLPHALCARCSSKEPEFYCHACSGHLCALCISTEAYYFPYQDLYNSASQRICASCSAGINQTTYMADDEVANDQSLSV